MIRYFFTLFFTLSLFALDAQDLIERTQLGISNSENRGASSANGIAATLQSKKQEASSRSSQIHQLFKVETKLKPLPANITKGVLLNLQKEILAEIGRQPSALLNLSIPVNESASFVLDLYQVNIYASGFEVTTSSPVDQVVNHTGIFYHGIIKGNPNSAVAVSIFDDIVDIFIQDHVGNYKVTTSTDNEGYTLYNGHNRFIKNKVACGTSGSKHREVTRNEVATHSRSNMMPEVPIYLEVDYALYQEQNRNLNTVTRFIEILVAETTALYARLEIPIKISRLKIHTTPDRYPSGVGDPKLTAFSEAIKGDFPGILAHLISGEEGGGIASLGVLCATYETDGSEGGPYGLSGIGEPNAQTPDLDDINTFAHELGHNFGSHHTQACFWNGNNTAIDGCVESEPLGDEEPTCSRPNTDCPAGGGTIMSYCSTPDAPLFDCIANNNWHPQVAAYIKSQYAEAISAGCIENVEDTEDTSIVDNDQDGFNNSQDCDDNNAQVNPNQTEIAYNGIDDDCNPATRDDDLDRDGFNNTVDCDDNNAQIYPGRLEIVYNGIDDDCNPATRDDDLDRDGFGRADDCNDLDSFIYPGASEIPDNGIDEDCNGQDAITVVDNNGDDMTDQEEEETPTNTETCAPVSGNLTTTSISDNNAYIYTPQPNGAINNQFRYRPRGNGAWIFTSISTNYYRYLSGLLSGTEYEFQVSQDCGNNTFSDFSASSYFTTTGQSQGGGNDGNVDENDGDTNEDNSPNTGNCSPVSGNLTTTSISDNNAYVYTPQPNGAINNQFRYRPIGSNAWELTNISTVYYRYLSGLLSGTEYEFQVNQSCGDGTYSDFSSSSYFTTTGVTQGGGNNNTDNTGGNGTQDNDCESISVDQLFVTSLGTSAAYVYTPQPFGATNNQFRYRQIGTATWNVTDINTLYYRYLTGLIVGTAYEYQVRHECSAGVWSSYSDSYEFTTVTNFQPNGTTEPMEYETFQKLSTSSITLNIQIAPNPVFSELILKLEQPFATTAIIRIYSISGKLIKELALQEGDLKTTIDVNNLQGGVYLLEYRTAELRKTIKFVKR